MSDSKKGAYGGAPSGDTDFRKTYDLDEYAAKANEREAKEKEEAKARYEAKLAGKKYHKPLTGDETYTSARRNVIDLTQQIGKNAACPRRCRHNKQYIEHLNTPQHLINTGQTTEVKRATAEEVHERIEYYIRRRDELEKEKQTSLHERLQLREEEAEKEAEERRKKRREDNERKRIKKEEEARVKMEYGEDVRVDGEHDEDDMMAAMGFTGFGTSKK
ncbi:U4/U6.U5 small nuclear ribonucleoprotein component snu23 [Fusarium oxysporum f. sp. raphani]|uniref:U4/U6.U5 small nuclear ribonucleoprotein component snu23 n=1 Tax=Fusarium oxysporum f. sp. raphani TaxID=96318 RepID=A0A8J5Q0Z2_FUSOX|nr:U4/U6.U5 small nuclear ribonucleoprotein component snu23 [Fusarium oxysporum f. sp. raphani]